MIHEHLERYYREERLPLKVYFDVWSFRIERERQLREARKKFHNINWDKL